LAPETAHVLEHQPREAAALMVGIDEDRQRAQAVGLCRVEPRAERLPPGLGHPRHGNRVALGAYLAVLDERELELRPLAVEPAPVRVRDRVVEDDLRPGAAKRLKRGPGSDLRVDRNDLHPSSSATAIAASPSPRPVNPRRSVVVARTVTTPGATPIASASRSSIAARKGAIRGASPTSTQSAFASVQPSARACS